MMADVDPNDEKVVWFMVGFLFVVLIYVAIITL